MLNFLARSIKGRLILSFVLVAVCPILVIGFFAVQKAGTALEKTEFEKLRSECELRKKQVLQYFEDTFQSLRFLAGTETVTKGLETLVSYHEYGKNAGDTPHFDTTSFLYKKIFDKINPFFQEFLNTHDPKSSGYEDLLLLCAKHGHVMYSSSKLEDLGTNLGSGSLKDSGLARAWSKVVKTGKPALIDFSVYKPVASPAAFAAVPILDEKGAVQGVLALRIGTAEMQSIFGSVQAVGKTAETYVVGEDFLMRSNSRSDKTSSILETKAESKATKEALLGKSATELIHDYRGVSVLSSYGPAGLKESKTLGAGFDWAVVAEVDRSEMEQPVISLRNYVTGFAVLIAFIVALAALGLSWNFARPLFAMSVAARHLSTGDLTVDVPKLARRDEIGTLAEAFRGMVEGMRNQSIRVLEGVNVLSAAASEISATVSQVTQGTTQTSSAVTETTTTLEEVRQAAKVASDEAGEVARSAHEAVTVSTEGKKATEDTVQGIHLIKEQMESIGETVVKLSERSQAIEEIIATVQDLADQSKLLAVNASIEAARAGDYGKGFSVVAHEIKSLADQSREATEQIRTILEDTRRWVSAVVMATEQGTKAVAAGVTQSVRAGESIESLSQSVGRGAQSASVIEVSTGQQTAGLEQVASAMKNIEQAVQQNLVGAQQLEGAARRLDQLGTQLKQMVEEYRV